MSYTKNALRRSAVLFGFTAVGSLCAYLLRFILARSLDTAEYGLFWAVYSFIFFFNFVADLGLGSAVVKFIPELQVKNKYNEIKGIILHTMKVQTGVAIAGAALFVFLAPYLAEHYFKNPHATMLIYILAATFALFPFNTLLNALHGFQNMFAYAAVSASKNVLALAATTILLQQGFRASAPAWGYLFAYVVLPILSLFFLMKVNFQKFFHIRGSIKQNMKKKLIAFGFPIMLTTLGSIVISYSDTMILTYFRTLEEVGYYNVALPLAMTLWLAVSSINAVILPMSSEMWARGHKKSLQTGLASLYRYILLVIVPAAILLVVFPEIVITLLFGQQYIEGAIALRVLALGAAIGSLGILNNSVLSGIGKPDVVSKIMGGAVIANIIGNLTLIPYFGIMGAAYATSLSYLLTFLISLYALETNIRFSIPLSFWAKILILATVFRYSIEFLKNALNYHPILEATIALVVAGLLYGACAFALNLINPGEIKDISKSIL